ncbi:uncharacterized protein LOC144584281 [Pogona vitticeps]
MDAWPSTHEEDSPLSGLPPLPKVFRESSSPPSPLPGQEEQEVAKPPKGSHASLQEKIAWLHREMHRLRLTDLALFNQLYNLALEIQDLKELNQEMENFSKEHLLADNQHHTGDIDTAMRFCSAGSFEMTF